MINNESKCDCRCSKCNQWGSDRHCGIPANDCHKPATE